MPSKLFGTQGLPHHWRRGSDSFKITSLSDKVTKSDISITRWMVIRQFIIWRQALNFGICRTNSSFQQQVVMKLQYLCYNKSYSHFTSTFLLNRTFMTSHPSKLNYQYIVLELYRYTNIDRFYIFTNDVEPQKDAGRWM